MYEDFGINKNLEEKANICENNLKGIFQKIDEDAMYNTKRVLKAFQENEVSDMHFGMTTGYGEGDVRKKCDRKDICKCT